MRTSHEGDGRDADRKVPVAHLEIMRKILMSLDAREREMLKRYYVSERSQEDVCYQFGATLQEFRDIRANARALFEKLRRRPPEVD